jgi:hypothetical protein
MLRPVAGAHCGRVTTAAIAERLITMAGKATDVSISGITEGAFDEWKTTYKVKFYSIPARCWCEFEYVSSSHPNYSGIAVYIHSPRWKALNLTSSDDSFKVGKVSCRLIYKRRTKTLYWVIDDTEYEMGPE